MKSNTQAFVAFALLLTSCAAPPAARQVAFNEADFARYAGSGSGSVIGQAFLKTRGGEVRYGAGNEVVMIPVVPYTTEYLERSTIGGQKLEPFDPRYANYRRVTRADGMGNFEFHNLPAGDYYLTCIIVWEVPSGYITLSTGGVAYAKVTVRSGQTSKVVLTR